MAAPFSTKLLVTGKSFNLYHALRPLIQVNTNIADNKYHPLHELVLEKLKAQDEPQLIINTTASIKKTSPKAVVRHKAVRRVREAAHQVLKEKGYGKDGKTKDGKGSLVGTLAFWATTETVLTPWEELKEEVRGAIEKWIALKQKTGGPMKVIPRRDSRPGLYTKNHRGGYLGRGAGGYVQANPREAKDTPWHN